MSEVYQRESVALPTSEVERPARRSPVPPRRRSPGSGVWWRHVARRRGADLVAVPHRLHRVGGAQPGRLAADQRAAAHQRVVLPTSATLFSDASRPYASWYKNSLLIAGVGALCSVFIGACAAFAFSRLRFVGRRPGLLALLLLQMFPALLAFVALYVTLRRRR